MSMSPDQQPMRRPLAENVAAASQDPCLRLLGELSMKLHELGVPEGMHRVGTIDGVETPGDGFYAFPSDAQIPALLPGVGEGHVALPEGDMNIEIARTLLYDILTTAPPGTVRIDVYDPQFTGAFSEFSGLPPEQYKLVAPGGLRSLLEEYSAHAAVMRNSPDVHPGTAANPWRVLAIAGESREIDPTALEQLTQLMHSGESWGSVVAVATPVLEDTPARTGWPAGLVVTPDRPLPQELLVHAAADLAKRSKELKPIDMNKVMPLGEVWTRSARNGLEVVLGVKPNGELLTKVLGDDLPNMIMLGRPGSGKTITIKALAMGLSENYSPEEFELWVFDYKEGAEFKGMAGAEYNPNVRLVGSNINNDPEFGIQGLRQLRAELARRGALGRELGAARYDAIRDLRPDVHLPRIVCAMDEFQVLLSDPQRGSEAADIIEEIARLGRSWGIHFLLASQDISGIQALYTKGGIFKTMPLRVSGQSGSLLPPNGVINNAPDDLPKAHLVVNADAGAPGRNEVVQTIAAFEPVVQERQKRLYKYRRPSDQAPRSFDADEIPKLKDSPDWKKLKPTIAAPNLIVADRYDMESGATRFKLDRAPGRNLAVVGSRREEVESVMNTALRSLVEQVSPASSDRISVVCLDRSHAQTVQNLVDELSEQGHDVEVIPESKARNFLAETRANLDPDSDDNHYIFVYQADSDRMTVKPPKPTTYEMTEAHKPKKWKVGETITAGSSLTEFGGEKLNVKEAGEIKSVSEDGKTVVVESKMSSGREEFAKLLESGSQAGVHVIASFTSPKRMADTVATSAMSSRAEGVGGWVSVGIEDSQMAGFTPGYNPTGRSNTTAPQRGRFFDRAAGGAKVSTIIPYDDDAVERPAADD